MSMIELRFLGPPAGGLGEDFGVTAQYRKLDAEDAARQVTCQMQGLVQPPGYVPVHTQRSRSVPGLSRLKCHLPFVSRRQGGGEEGGHRESAIARR